MSPWTRDLALGAYGDCRIKDQVEYYARQATRYEKARRRALTIAASLFVLATLSGALGTVDERHRGVWAFLAAGLAALGTTVTSYESAFSFEMLARQYRDTIAALKIAEAKGPVANDTSLTQYVQSMELLLRSEVETWSRLSVALESLTAARAPTHEQPQEKATKPKAGTSGE